MDVFAVRLAGSCGVELETRYVRNGDVTISWAATAPRELDLLLVLGTVTHELLPEDPGLGQFFARLASFARLIALDRRGIGLSDSVDGPIALDDEVGDLEAVLDAAGSERAVVFATASGGPPAIRLAATRPERVQALVLYAAMPTLAPLDDLGFGFDEETRVQFWSDLASVWGTGASLTTFAPSRVDDPKLRSWVARNERRSLTPGALPGYAAQIAAHDARGDLEGLRVPTLVLHRRGDLVIDPRHSQLIAERVPGARLVELEGDDHLVSAGDSAAVLGEVEEFLTGGRRRRIARELLTVLFTDVVDATGHAGRLGDARWRTLLATHDATVRGELERFGGREVKTIGDAFLVTFPGPPSEAVRCARAVVGAVAPLGLTLRAGLHTGECEVVGDDVGGMAVHLAARIAALAGPGQVLASGTTYGTVVGSGLRFDDLGMRELKGVAHHWPVFALADEA
jgi:class 3 adenylate cyclase